MKYTIVLVLTLLILSGCSSQPASTIPSADPAPPPSVDVSVSADSVESKVHEENFDLDAYKRTAQQLSDKITSSSIALGNMGKWENSFMKSLGRSSDDIVERAYAWLEENSDYTQAIIEEENVNISELFSALVKDGDKDGASEIFDLSNKLVNSYTALYCTVTTPPISPKIFAEELSEYFSAVAEHSDALQQAIS